MLHSRPPASESEGFDTRRTSRVYSLALVDIDEAARRLVESTFTLCTGFRVYDPATDDGVETSILVLNDSTSEDGAQEYAIVVEVARYEVETLGRQVESVTFGWIDDPAGARRALEKGLAYARGKEEPPISVPIVVRHDHPEPCDLCR